MRRNDAVTSVSDMEHLSAVGKKLVDDLSSLSHDFDVERDPGVRDVISRSARTTRSKALHPSHGGVPLDIVMDAMSRELTDAIRALPRIEKGGNK
jgi:hypothetical protein